MIAINIFKMRSRFSLLVFLSVLLLLLVIGCSKKDTDQKSKKYKIGFVTNCVSDFWVVSQKGCRQAEKELGDVTVDFRIAGESTSAEQRRMIDDLISKGVDAIAISPIDPENQKPLIDGLAEKIPLITCDSDIIGSKRLCYLGTDNYAAGKEVGKLVKEVLPEGGKTMIFIGKKDSQNSKERIQGVVDSLKDTNIQILDIRTDDVDPVRAKANAVDALTKHPDLKCCIGLWNYNAPAVVNALKDVGKVRQVKIVSFDEDPDTLAGIRDGHIYATVAQQPFEFGYQSVILLAKILRGDKSVIPTDGLIIIPNIVIKKDNVEEFIKKSIELRGR